MSFPIAVNLAWEEMMTERSTQAFPLGTVGRMLDGRSFRYAKNGAVALPVGCVVQGVATQVWSVAGTSGPNALIAGTTQTSTWRVLSIGTTNTTAVTKDYFKDGWISVSATGRYAICGQMLQIKGNIASTAATAYPQTLSLELYDDQRLTKTLNTSDCGFSISRNLYDSVIEVAQAAAPTADVLGVPPITVTASTSSKSYYFWLQTWGRALVECAEAVAVSGSGIVWCTDAASTGAISSYGSTGILGYDSIGSSVTGGIAGAYVVVNLKIQP